MKIQLTGEAFHQISQAISAVHYSVNYQHMTEARHSSEDRRNAALIAVVPVVRFIHRPHSDTERLTISHPSINGPHGSLSNVVQGNLIGLFAKVDHELSKNLPSGALTGPDGENNMTVGVMRTLDIHLGYRVQEPIELPHFALRLSTKTNFRDGSELVMHYPTFKCEVEVTL